MANDPMNCHQRSGQPDNVGPSENDDVQAVEIDPGAIEELNAAERGAANERSQTTVWQEDMLLLTMVRFPPRKS